MTFDSVKIYKQTVDVVWWVSSKGQWASSKNHFCYEVTANNKKLYFDYAAGRCKIAQSWLVTVENTHELVDTFNVGELLYVPESVGCEYLYNLEKSGTPCFRSEPYYYLLTKIKEEKDLRLSFILTDGKGMYTYCPSSAMKWRPVPV